MAMNGVKIDLSQTGRARVILVSVVVTLGCIVLSMVLASFGFGSYDEEHNVQRVFATLIVPTVVAFPVMYFLMSKLRELAIAHSRLTVFASTDGLTQVMNRVAFSTLVDAHLAEARSQNDVPRGALLIIDADNFKSVNDRYGHDRGDEALVTIALTIKSILRSPDIVGRIGGEEFGVFLPGATTSQVETVAERIRQTINDVEFMPSGAVHRLSVSVGGAVFEHRLPFTELFRLADQQLYAAKQSGRNRVAITRIRDNGSLAAA